MGDNKYISILDLKSGFLQIPLKEKNIEKTAFAINGGKFEITRLPFGLKNSPFIFQRALDDILREHVGKICYVYIDDIIVFNRSENEHATHLDEIFATLEKANMKVQMDKCEFFKVKAIENFPIPTTLKELISFLGLATYYRRFLLDYAKLARPLTNLLRGENGRDDAISAFDKIRRILASQDVILAYPDFSKEFKLTTDASNFAISLEQDSRPITFIFRTLLKTEENYAANEKEMLTIVWALQSLRMYLHGTAKVIIYLITNH